jgi:hypothetical protein
MDKLKHTPGPWRYDYAPGFCGELLAPNGTTIAEFITEPNDSDARLLAAAPDLLEALKALTATTDVVAYGAALHQARAAIAKAEGLNKATGETK